MSETGKNWPNINGEILFIKIIIDGVCCNCGKTRSCFQIQQDVHIESVCQSCVNNLAHDTEQRISDGPTYNEEGPF